MRLPLLISVLLLAAGICLPAQTFVPVPHEVRYFEGKGLNVSRGVVLLDVMGDFRENVDFLPVKRKGVTMTVDYGEKVSIRHGVRQVSGAYVLQVDAEGITVTGYDERGAFYGLKTLRQLVAMNGDMILPFCKVDDWPEKESRGFTDGMSMRVRTHEAMKSLIELAGRLNMTHFVYAPKDDPYVGSPHWYLSYSQIRADMLEELMDLCERNRMEFTWCIRPDQEFSWTEEDYAFLLGKLEMMHYIGVRSFGIILDDIPYEEGIEEKKTALVERLNRDFAAPKEGVGPLLTSLDGYYAPLEGGNAMKLGIYGVASRGWNMQAYDPMKCLEWAIGETAPAVAGPYMTYALHSEVSRKAFGLDESAHIDLIPMKDYSRQEFETLMAEFKAIENVPSQMAAAPDNMVLDDLEPWLEEFGRLGRRCRMLLESMDLFNEGDIPGFWVRYANNMMSDRDMDAYLAHPSGTERLQPYYERMVRELVDAFYHEHQDKVEYEHIHGEGVDTYIAPLEAGYCHLILDNPQEKEVIVRLSDAEGRYTAEFCIETSYLEFELKADAVKVEVIGDVDILETVFVK